MHIRFWRLEKESLKFEHANSKFVLVNCSLHSVFGLHVSCRLQPTISDHGIKQPRVDLFLQLMQNHLSQRAVIPRYQKNVASFTHIIVLPLFVNALFLQLRRSLLERIQLLHNLLLRLLPLASILSKQLLLVSLPNHNAIRTGLERFDFNPNGV